MEGRPQSLWAQGLEPVRGDQVNEERWELDDRGWIGEGEVKPSKSQNLFLLFCIFLS